MNIYDVAELMSTRGVIATLFIVGAIIILFYWFGYAKEEKRAE